MKRSFIIAILSLGFWACCPTEDIITVDVSLADALFKNYSSETFQPVQNTSGITYTAFTIVSVTSINGLEDFESPNRRFLQSPDCDTSDPEYNLEDPVVAIEIIPQQDYNNDFPAGSNMSSVFYSAYLVDNPMLPEPELRVHGNTIDVDAFNSYFINYHDVIRRQQQPIRDFGMKPTVAPSVGKDFSFEINIKLSSGRIVSAVTPTIFIAP